MRSWPDHRVRAVKVRAWGPEGKLWMSAGGPDSILRVSWDETMRVGYVEFSDVDGRCVEIVLPDNKEVIGRWVRALKMVERLYEAYDERGEEDNELLLDKAASEDGIEVL